MSAIGVAALAAFVVILLSFDSIASMFQERAQLIQSYDVGQGGRFCLQELALTALLDFPNGMGPFEFARVHGLQQHNVYLQAFLVYGWAGGMAYLMLLVATFWTALRTVLRAHAVAALSDLRLRRLRRRSGRRLRDRHRSLAAFLSSARHDLGLGGRDVQSRTRRDPAAGGEVCPMSALLEFAAARAARRRGRSALRRLWQRLPQHTRLQLFFSLTRLIAPHPDRDRARRISARHRRPVLDRERCRRRRPPRLCRARRRRLRTRRLRPQRRLRPGGIFEAAPQRRPLSPGGGSLIVHHNGPYMPHALVGARPRPHPRPPHHRLLGLGTAAAAGRYGSRASATCTKSGCRAHFTRDAVAAATDLPVHVVPHPLPTMPVDAEHARQARPAGGRAGRAQRIPSRLGLQPQESARRHRRLPPGLRRCARPRAGDQADRQWRATGAARTRRGDRRRRQYPPDRGHVAGSRHGRADGGRRYRDLAAPFGRLRSGAGAGDGARQAGRSPPAGPAISIS